MRPVQKLITPTGALKRAGVQPTAVDMCYMGHVLTAGAGQSSTKQAALAAGLPPSVVCTGVNKVCASGLKAITMAAQEIALGNANIVVAGGMENMSLVPHYVGGLRFGLRMGDSTAIDGVIHDGLFCQHTKQHMGMCAEACATEHSISRAQQDEYAKESYQRAIAAWSSDMFHDEIEPVTAKQGRKEVVVEKDEECFRHSVDALPSMRPSFRKDGQGTVTSGNASSLNDGAAAVVLMSHRQAERLGCPILGWINAFADAEQEPLKFTTSPYLAIPKALTRAGVNIDDVDVFEINEAFAVVAAANLKLLKLPADKVNVRGGAVALGHPIGCSGARIVVTLLNVMRHRNAQRGVAAVCNGGGGATAVVLERQVSQQSQL